MLFNNFNNDNDANFLSLALLHNLSNSYARLFSKYYLPYYNLFNKMIINPTNEFFNNDIFNWSPYLLNSSFNNWLIPIQTKSKNESNQSVDLFKEYIEI